MDETPATLKLKLDSLKVDLCRTETEESWDIIAKSISALDQLCQSDNLGPPSEFLASLKALQRPLTSAMVSERTRLSGVAIEFVGNLANSLGPSFEPLLNIFLPTLLALCGRTNRVMVTRARSCILSIIETTHLPTILPFLLQSVKDKSASLRMVAAEATLVCLNCFNPPDLEKDARAQEIESVIRGTALDANAEVRKISRKIFEAYQILLPHRVDNFTAPLTPTIKRYLDIKTDKSTSRAPTKLVQPTTKPNDQSSKHVASSKARHVNTHTQPNPVSLKTVMTGAGPSRTQISTSKSQHGNDAAVSMLPPSAPVRPILPPKTIRGPQANIMPNSFATNTAGSGPKRVPLPVTSERPELKPVSRPPSAASSTQPDARLNQKRTLDLTRSQSKTNLSTTSSKETAAPPKPIFKKPISIVPPRKTAPNQKSVVSTVAKPTQSQLSRMKDLSERKAPIAKPTWGRPILRTQAPKPDSRGSTKTTDPLTTSTTGGSKKPVPCEKAITLQPNPQPELDVEPQTQPQPKTPEPPIVEHVEELPSAPDSPTILQEDILSSSTPHTEKDLLEEGEIVSTAKTPISALLTSIQRGFIFTPSSPLSPPQQYLNQLQDVTKGLNIPLQLQSDFNFREEELGNPLGPKTVAQDL